VVYREWFYDRNFAEKEMVITRFSAE